MCHWAGPNAYLEALLHDVPELLGLGVAGVLNLEVSSLGNDLLSGKGTLGVSPSRILPPGLDLLDLLVEDGVFGVGVDADVVHVVGSHDDDSNCNSIVMQMGIKGIGKERVWGKRWGRGEMRRRGMR